MTAAIQQHKASRNQATVDDVLSTKRVKLGEVIARRIEDQIISEGWPVGHPLGSEAELAAAAQVSRWSFREAVALLEHSGLVESRRGRSGGLFVAAPLAEMVFTAISNYLIFVRTTSSEYVNVLCAVESVMIERTSGRLGVQACEELLIAAEESESRNTSDAIAASAKIRSILLEQARDPALTLLSGVISNTMLQAGWYSTLGDDQFRSIFPPVINARGEVARALIKGDTERARRFSANYVDACERLLISSGIAGPVLNRTHSVERAYRLYPAGRPAKKAESVARELREMIIDAGWPIGLHLGTQEELMQRLNVGRAVLREALRSLERLGVIEIGRGSRSGVRTISPSPVEIIASSRRFLRRERVASVNIKELLSALEQNRLRAFASAHKDGQTSRLTLLLLEIFQEPF